MNYILTQRFAAVMVLLMLVTASAKAGPIGLTFRDTTVAGGKQFDYPVYIDSSVTGLNVTSYQFEVTFNTSSVTFVGAIADSTLSAGWGAPTFSTISSGRVRIASAGASPLVGKGKMVFLRFQALSSQYTLYSSCIFQNTILNEGTPTTVLKNGSITILAVPTIAINPNTWTMTKGDTKQFFATGGTLPYTWSVTNGAAASINSGGLLTALQAGLTKVICTDSSGIVDTSGTVEVRALAISLRDTARYQGQYLNLPIYTTDVTGLGIVSGQFTMTFDPNLWQPLQLVVAGTLLQSASLDTFSVAQNKITISFATTAPLSGKGILVYLQLKASSTMYGSSYFNFPSTPVFNETILSNYTGGYTNVTALTPVIITINGTQNLVVGDSLFFSASGGTPPYLWSVSDTSRASISSVGWLKAKKSGTVTVSAQDVLTSVGTSGLINLFDFRLTVPDSSYMPVSTIDVPLYVTPNKTGFSALSLKINYTTGLYIRLVDVISTGTLTDGMIGDASYSTGSVTIAKAGSNPITAGGILLKLRFSVSDTTPRPAYMNVSVASVMFNEGIPLALIHNGNIAIANRSAFSINPSSWSIQSSAINKKDSTVIAVYNTGTAALTSTINIVGTSEFTLSPTSLNVAAGDSAKVKVYYQPVNAGTDTASMNFSTNDPYHPLVSVLLVGKVVLFPLLQLSPNTVNFGTVKTGQWKDTTITITNSGSDTLAISGITATDAAFSARPAAAKIPPGGSLTDTLRFAPSMISTINAFCIIVSNASSSPDTIKVSGTGQSPLGLGGTTTVPSVFSMDQNYPNPFNPSTTIQFTVPEQGRAVLRVYNLIGQEITELFNGVAETGRVYREVFEAGDLASGMYFARLTFGNKQLLTKMTLMK